MKKTEEPKNMIISCRECLTRFIVAPQAIGPHGRLVKCSNCLQTWFQEPPEEEMEIVPEIVIEENKVAQEPPQRSETTNPQEEDVRPGDEPLRKNVPALVNKPRANVVIGWVVLSVFLVGGGLSVYFFRDFISGKSETAEVLYQKWDTLYSPPISKEAEALPPKIVTKPHPASFLTLRQSVSINFKDGQPNLVIFLDIQNTGAEDVALPELHGVIRDAKGKDLFFWSQKLDPGVIPAGGFRQYEIYVDSIQTASREAEVFFNWDKEN